MGALAQSSSSSCRPTGHVGIPYCISLRTFCPLRQRSGFSTVEFVELQTNRTRRHPILHLLANYFALCASGVALAQSSSSSCRPNGPVGQLSRKRKEFEAGCCSHSRV